MCANALENLKPIQRVLIANRGEIAVRVIRACRELGLSSIAVYSEADRSCLHTKMANEAICLGGGGPANNYLSIGKIIAAAQDSRADAIHPGYGFLSENEKFAEACAENSIIFIGPPAEAIRLLGNKADSRKTAQTAGVSVIPGSEGAVYTVDEALEAAEKVGYPVIIKASGGGGGRGMRQVLCREEMKSAIESARAEAAACCGSDEVYIEKSVQRARHIEFQILADQFGNMVYMGDRDCSIQRKKQKFIEEAPSAALTPELRGRIGEDAVRVVRSAGFVGAGTVEFLLDEHGCYYFMEMNTRIQVEHPVTELVTGLDIIQEQIRIADGRRLSIAQQDVSIHGHAIECRINAEDPNSGFRPSIGVISGYKQPAGFGIRVDSHIYEGYKLPLYYDSLLAKLIVWGEDRHTAIQRMRYALDNMKIDGVKTNQEFIKNVLADQHFISGDIDTNFIEREILNANRQKING